MPSSLDCRSLGSLMSVPRQGQFAAEGASVEIGLLLSWIDSKIEFVRFLDRFIKGASAGSGSDDSA